MEPRRPSRRLRFAIIVLISQILLTALSLAWAIHMAIIFTKGKVYFVEDNQLILWLEIIVTILICLFGTTVFIMQLRRLRERRVNDESRENIREK